MSGLVFAPRQRVRRIRLRSQITRGAERALWLANKAGDDRHERFAVSMGVADPLPFSVKRGYKISRLRASLTGRCVLAGSGPTRIAGVRVWCGSTFGRMQLLD